MLEVSLFKSVLHKLKILGGGNLNSVKQWGEPQNKFWNFSEGKQKRGDSIFESNLVEGEILEEIMGWKQSTKHH